MTALNANEGTNPAARSNRERFRLCYEHVQGLAFACDAAIIIITSIVSGLVYHFLAFSSSGDLIQYSAFGLMIAIIFSSVNHIRRLYSGDQLFNVIRQARNVFFNLIFTFFLLTTVAFALKISDLISRGYVLLFFLFALTALLGCRYVWRDFLRLSLDRGLFVRRRILTICDGNKGSDATISELQRYGHMPVSQLILPAGEISDQEIPIIIKQVAAASYNLAIDEIVITVSMQRFGIVTQLVDALRSLPLPVRFAVDGPNADVISRSSHKLGSILSFQVQRHPLSLSERALKRLFDMSIALIALITLAPIMLLTAILIKLTTPGPILFRQMRFGANGRKFEILKFRSMTMSSEGSEFRQASRNDARVTWVGRFIRRSSIDELPQLWNVLRGEMSIVGPRPHAVAHDEAYEDLIQRYAMRRFMKPGLSGWAQVNGSRGETPTIESMELRVQHDLWYIDNWSIWLDSLIVIRTAIMLCNPKDVY
ncbi:undecaprenyl-phosphate glucose phosphotransferase [Bosea sp. BE109]|uniref:undecaprenyl-phosphate glucose phosphotransferase n=2 Tax=Boseaceae TaxID=2831100 RepID=UPI00286BA097|nr:undecaprenyl-phosphate glucose phosphotransferase [Bosea sp. BE109]